MKNELDHLFEQGVSGVSRAPRQMLTDAEIASATAASKTGAGIWLLAHAKEILIGAVSFVVGVGGTLVVTCALQDKTPLELPAEQTTLVATDSLFEEPLTDESVVYTTESYEHAVVQLENQKTSAGNGPKVSSPKQETVKTTNPQATATSTTSEPVVIKKINVQRDTVRLRETFIVKDTVIIN